MVIDQDNVGYFLAERGLLTFDSIVDGDFIILDQSSRNRNLKIIRRRSPGYFIKQLSQQTPEFLESMEREAACYRLATRDQLFRSLRALIPKLHHYDSRNHILILELLPDAETLWEYHRRTGSYPVEIAELQGKRLGTYHDKVRVNGKSKGLEVFKRQLPWI